MSLVFEQLAKNIDKLFALGCMGLFDVNGTEQFQDVAIEMHCLDLYLPANQMLLLGV